MTLAPFWFQINGGDTLKKTGALSSEAIGCWLLLKIHLLEAPRLPMKKEELLRVCKGAQWREVMASLSMFDTDEKGYKFCKEMEMLKCKMKSTSEKRKTAGQAGAKSRWQSKLPSQ